MRSKLKKKAILFYKQYSKEGLVISDFWFPQCLAFKNKYNDLGNYKI